MKDLLTRLISFMLRFTRSSTPEELISEEPTSLCTAKELKDSYSNAVRVLLAEPQYTQQVSVGAFLQGRIDPTGPKDQVMLHLLNTNPRGYLNMFLSMPMPISHTRAVTGVASLTDEDLGSLLISSGWGKGAAFACNFGGLGLGRMFYVPKLNKWVSEYEYESMPFN